MAPRMSLPRSLPAGAFICRNCLRSRPIRGQPQRRWLGRKYLAKLIRADEEWASQAEEISAGKRKNLFDELDERGFIKDVLGTKDLLRETMRRKRISAYSGVDPTARSLHLGHIVAFMPLFWMYLHGYGGYTLIGTSTAKIGDPTGRTESRPQLSPADLTQNLASVHHQLKTTWANVEQFGIRFGWKYDWAWRRGIINNNSWWNKKPMLEVMKRLGNHIRVGPMLGRDNVKTRLQGNGLSFSELAYPLMQGWDWFELFRQRGVQWQIGGSDQYGNILTGAECVRHCVESEQDASLKLPTGTYDQPMGFTVPLLTDASGAKFGKSAGNAIWLDPYMTTPYNLYGYLVRRSDDEVGRLLKLLTFHPLDTIAQVMEEHMKDPRQRIAQHLLAHEVVWLVHSKVIADRAQNEHRSVYGVKTPPLASSEGPAEPVLQSMEHYTTHPDPDQSISANNHPRIDVKLPRHLLGLSLARIMFACGLATSIGDGDRNIKAGGVYVGGSPGGGVRYQKGMPEGELQFTPLRNWNPNDTQKFLIDDKILLLRKGRHNLRCIELVSEEEWEASGLEYPGQPMTGAFRKAMETLKGNIKTARQKKEEMGHLAEEDKVDPLADEIPLNERSCRKRKAKLQQAEKDGLVQGEKW